jgi:hypothetical protein
MTCDQLGFTTRCSCHARHESERARQTVCTELKISRRFVNRWRALGTGPRVKHLAGNGSVRIRRSWLNEWLNASDEDVA